MNFENTEIERAAVSAKKSASIVTLRNSSARLRRHGAAPSSLHFDHLAVTMETYVRLLLTLYAMQGAASLQLTELRVPTHAARGSAARLECHFDLEGDVLYTIKWYKDGQEFYQYVPAYDLPKQDFPLPGVNVDLEQSSRNTVTLVNVGSAASGHYRCEVSGEAPSFDTKSKERTMHVVVLPENGPVLSGGSARYTVGDVAELNCTSAASQPPTRISWLLNGRPPPRHYVREPWQTAMPNGTAVVTSRMLFVIKPKDFLHGYLNIQCVATISSLYEESDVHQAEHVDLVSHLPEPVLHHGPPVGATGEDNPGPKLDHATSTGTEFYTSNGRSYKSLTGIICFQIVSTQFLQR